MTTPLAYAISNNHLDAMTLLIDNGAIIDDYERIRPIPLKVAIKFDNVEAFRLLLDRGADTDIIKEDYGAYNMMDSPNIFEEMIIRRIEPIDQTLLDVIEAEWIEGIHIVMRYGADINKKYVGNDYYTIESSFWHGSKDICGGSIDIYNATPLQSAIFLQRGKCIPTLLEYGADKTIKNGNGLTARDIAIMTLSFDIVKLLDNSN